MITMRRDGDAWIAVSDLDLKVTDGVLDALSFDIPTQAGEPIAVEPPMKQEWARAASDDRRRLVLHPTEPIAGSQHIRLTVPVTAGAADRVRVPELRPIDIGKLRRFVRLPTNSNGQELVWEPHGLNFERLPGSFAMTSPTTEVYRTCEVIADRFDAVLQSVQSGPANPRVRLSDIRLVMSDERTGYGAAAFDVVPAGAGSCLLDMPSDFRLIHSEVNGAPAIQRQAAANQWNVAFADAKLPQRLGIVYAIDRTAVVSTDAMPTFRPPSLVGFAVDQTLWSIDAAMSVKLADDQESTKTITLLKRQTIDLESATTMLGSTAGLVANASEQSLSSILTFDARHAISARSEVDRQRKRATTAANRQAAATAIDAADTAREELARRYGLQELFADVESQTSTANGLLEVGQAISQDARHTATVFAGAGPSGALVVLPWAPSYHGFQARWPTALVVVSIITAVFWILGRPGVAEIAASRPQRLAIAAGVAWWFWLEPSIVGLAIVVLSLAAPLWRWRWLRIRRRDLSSSRRLGGGKSSATATAPPGSARGRVAE
jgi:hypothetical protein